MDINFVWAVGGKTALIKTLHATKNVSKFVTL